MNSKVEIAEQIIEHIDGKLIEIGRAIDERVQAAREAETRNQSRYDTKGWEAAREAEGAERIRKGLEQQKRFFLQLLEKLKTQKTAQQLLRVVPGSLIELKSHSGHSKWIFLVNCPGGIDTQDVSVVSAAAPIAQRILNMRIGGEVILTDEKYGVSQIL